MLEAARRYRFRRVIGVDFVPRLTDLARETVDRNRDRLKCRDIELVTQDVVDYEVPDDVTVTYLYDPFRGQVFDAVIAKLIASVDRNPRRLRLIYAVPEEAQRLEATGRVRLVRRGRRMVRRWLPRTSWPSTRSCRPAFSSGASIGLSHPAEPVSQAGRSRLRPEMTIVRLESPPVGPTAISIGSQRDVRRLRDEFERSHCVRLPGLVSDVLLDRILPQVDEGEFSVREHKGISTELCMESGKAPAMLMFLTNDPGLFELVRAITGCDRIGAFNGRLYRMMPGPEHQDSWHEDLKDNRMVAMSINLTPLVTLAASWRFVTGIRKRFCTHCARGHGGCVALPHLSAATTQGHPVEGEVARTAWAGWFMGGPDFVLLSPNDAGASDPERGSNHE